MASIFDISVPNAVVSLNKNGQANVTITVSNAHTRRVTGRAMIIPDDALGGASYTLNQEAEQVYDVDETRQYVVGISVPSGAKPGTYHFRLNMLDVDSPDENYTQGPTVAFEIPESDLPIQRRIPWRIPALVLAGIVLVAILAFGALQLLPRTEATSIVPRLEGLAVSQAMEQLEGLGFEVADETREEFSDDLDEGLVVGTEPEAGSIVDQGTVVTLVVSAGLEPVVTESATPSPDVNATATAQALESTATAEAAQTATAQAAEATATAEADTRPPQISITSVILANVRDNRTNPPTEGLRYIANFTTSDNKPGEVNTQCRLDSTRYVDCTTGWRSPLVSDDDQLVWVKATDAAGNSNECNSPPSSRARTCVAAGRGTN